MEINAAMVRDLRELTGAGLMECKRALEATKGDREAAIDHLRKQGLKSAEKKSAREMGEGRVAVFVAPKSRVGAMVAMTCETDFLASTQDFQDFLKTLAQFVTDTNPSNLDALLAAKWPKTGTSVADGVKLLVGKLGENIQIARFVRLENLNGRVGAYVHHDQKKGAIVSVTTDADEAKTQAILRELCMHITVFAPEAAKRSQISPESIERERAIYFEEVKSKPKDMQEKILAGKLEKFYADKVLPEQKWMKDDTKTAQKILQDALGAGAVIEAFDRFQIGK
jgi:elongation factor Ts